MFVAGQRAACAVGWVSGLRGYQQAEVGDYSVSGSRYLTAAVSAWDAAAELLLWLIDNAEHDLAMPGRWGGVPYVELSVGAESRHDIQAGEQLVLGDVLDLERFGPSDRRDQLTELFVLVPSVPG